MDLDRTVIERRQPKLTEKGKAYRITEKKGKETSLKEKFNRGLVTLGHLWDLIKTWNLSMMNP